MAETREIGGVKIAFVGDDERMHRAIQRQIADLDALKKKIAESGVATREQNAKVETLEESISQLSTKMTSTTAGIAKLRQGLGPTAGAMSSLASAAGESGSKMAGVVTGVANLAGAFAMGGPLLGGIAAAGALLSVFTAQMEKAAKATAAADAAFAAAFSRQQEMRGAAFGAVGEVDAALAFEARKTGDAQLDAGLQRRIGLEQQESALLKDQERIRAALVKMGNDHLANIRKGVELGKTEVERLDVVRQQLIGQNALNEQSLRAVGVAMEDNAMLTGLLKQQADQAKAKVAAEKEAERLLKLNVLHTKDLIDAGFRLRSATGAGTFAGVGGGAAGAAFTTTAPNAGIGFGTIGGFGGVSQAGGLTGGGDLAAAAERDAARQRAAAEQNNAALASALSGNAAGVVSGALGPVGGALVGIWQGAVDKMASVLTTAFNTVVEAAVQGVAFVFGSSSGFTKGATQGGQFATSAFGAGVAGAVPIAAMSGIAAPAVLAQGAALGGAAAAPAAAVALAAALQEAVVQTKSYAKFQAAGAATFHSISMALEPVFEGLIPLMGLFHLGVSAINTLLGPAVSSLAEMIGGSLFFAMKNLGLIALDVGIAALQAGVAIYMMTAAANAALGDQAGAAQARQRAIGLTDMLIGAKEAKANLLGIEPEDMNALVDMLTSANEGLGLLGETASDVASSMRNIPDFFNLGMARRDASRGAGGGAGGPTGSIIQRPPGAGSSGGGHAGEHDGASGGMTVLPGAVLITGGITVRADDPQHLMDRIQYQRYQRGRPVEGGSPFAGEGAFD